MAIRDVLVEALRPVHVCASVGVYVTWKVVHALYLSPLRNVPGPFLSRISWLPMRLNEVFGTEPEMMVQHCEKYGSIFVMEPNKVAVCDPHDCMMILGTHAFRKDYFYERVDFMEPNIFLTTDPELNRHRRRQIGPALNLRSLLHMEPTILAAGAGQLVAKWGQAITDAGAEGKARICYFDDLLLMAFDVMASLNFGQVHRSLTTGDRKIVNWVRQSFSLMFLQMVVPIFKRQPLKLLVGSISSQVDQFFAFGMEAIETRKRLLERGGEKPKDILQSFLDAEDPESKIRMTPSQVVTETILALTAGADTSSLTLSWTIHLLLLNPEHLQRAAKEVRDAFAADHIITYEEAKKSLPYLEACLYESMRLCPVSNNLPRRIQRGGVVLQGHFIPEGFSCAVSIAASNMNKDAWDRPHVFDPERFLNNDDNRRNLLTFSAGVRVCPGRHLAWWEMTTALANILNAFDLDLPKDALFTPDRLDARGRPVIMPGYHGITRFPRHPSRDCVVMVSRRKDAISTVFCEKIGAGVE